MILPILFLHLQHIEFGHSRPLSKHDTIVRRQGMSAPNAA
jgi:hypothetical protein